MSGVLNRMAQRALGTLPGLEPLMAPRYAATREQRQGLDGEQGMTVEVETVAPAGGREPERREHAAAGGGLEARDQHDEPEKDSADAQRVREPETPTARPLAKAAGENALLKPAPRARVEPKPNVEMKPAESGPRAQRGEERSDAGKDAEGGRRAESRAEFEPRGKTFAAGERSRQEATPVRDAGKGKRLVAEKPLPTERGGAPKPVPQFAVGGGEKTEIHISIGAIELRAPRAVERPAAAAYRPRVTLDDFLGRGQERRP